MRKLTTFALVCLLAGFTGTALGQSDEFRVFVSGGPTKKIFTIDESGLEEVFSAKKGFKPGAIAVDTQGRAFICDESNSEIHILEQEESTGDWIFTTIYNQGDAVPPSPEQPVGCAFLGGNLYFGERSGTGGGHGVWVIAGADTTPTSGPFNPPTLFATVPTVGGDRFTDVARAPDASLLVTRGDEILISRPPLYDGFTTLIDLPSDAVGLAVSSIGEIYVSLEPGLIETFDATGESCGIFVDAFPLQPTGMEFDLSDNLIFAAPLRNGNGGDVRTASAGRRCDPDNPPPPPVAGTVLAEPDGHVDVGGSASAVSRLLVFEDPDPLTAKLCASLFSVDPEFIIANPDCQVTVTCREMPLAEFEARTEIYFPDTTCMKTPISSGGNCTEMIVEAEGDCLGGLTEVEWIFFVTENVTIEDLPGFLYSEGTADPPFVEPFFENILTEFRAEVPDLPNDPGLKAERINFGSSVVGVINAPNRAPIADAGEDQTIGCDETATIDGSASFDRDPIDAEALTFAWTSTSFIPAGAEDDPSFIVDAADLGIGTHVYTLMVTDTEGLTDTAQVAITVTGGGTSLVIQSLTADPSTLWPPNHELIPITLTVDAIDDCSPPVSCHVSDVTMNDSDEGNGAGTFPDWFFNGSVTVEAPGMLSLELRAERSEGSNSVDDTRVYTVTVECENATGGSATSTVDVTVVSDQGDGG